MLTAAEHQMRDVDAAVQYAAIHGHHLRWAEMGFDPPLLCAYRAMLKAATENT